MTAKLPGPAMGWVLACAVALLMGVPVSAETTRYTYDDLGRLVQAKDDGSGKTVNYDYDAAGNRVFVGPGSGGGGGGVAELTPSSWAATTTASGYTGLTVAGMKDGAFSGGSTAHRSQSESTPYATANLGAIKTLDHIDIAPETTTDGDVWANTIVISYSTNGSSWTTGPSVSGTTIGSYKTIPMTGLQAQYVRMTSTWGMIIVGDFRIFGSSGGGSGPTAVNDTVAGNYNAPKTFDPRTNDTGTNLTVSTVTQPPSGQGSASNTSTSVTYTPPTGFSGTTSFTYTISDGSGTSTATVNVTVTAPTVAELIPSSWAASSTYPGFTGLTTTNGVRDNNFSASNSTHFSNAGGTPTATADLGASKTIDHVDIAAWTGTDGVYWCNTLTISYSTDGSNWTSGPSVTGVTSGSYKTIAMSGVTARYIRLNGPGGLVIFGDFRPYGY